MVYQLAQAIIPPGKAMAIKPATEEAHNAPGIDVAGDEEEHAGKTRNSEGENLVTFTDPDLAWHVCPVRAGE